jgi:pimeloyl-ACP methyl ester carboxylesterase
MARRSSDPIKAGARRARAQRRVGAGAACTVCGETRAEALVARSRPRLCIQCYERRRGKKSTQGHHVGAKANAPLSVEIPANDHRTLSDAQYEWPPPTLQNPDGSPLIALAGCLRGIADFIGDLPEAEQNVVWATNYPPAADLFNAPMGTPAWKTKPSWYIVGKNDRAVPPDLERFVSKRMGAHTIELDSSHCPMLSQPRAVVDMILHAANGIH